MTIEAVKAPNFHSRMDVWKTSKNPGSSRTLWLIRFDPKIFRISNEANEFRTKLLLFSGEKKLLFGLWGKKKVGESHSMKFFIPVGSFKIKTDFDFSGRNRVLCIKNSIKTIKSFFSFFYAEDPIKRNLRV